MAIATLDELGGEATDDVVEQVLTVGCRKLDTFFKASLDEAGPSLEERAFGEETTKMRSYALRCINEWRLTKIKADADVAGVTAHGQHSVASSSHSGTLSAPGFGKGKKRIARKR